MDRLKKFEKYNIEKIIKDNFVKLMPTFCEMESTFLSGLYKRYGDLEGGNIVIYFARDLHLEILRKRENDLDFDLSLDFFWRNHKNIKQGKKKIISVDLVIFQMNCWIVLSIRFVLPMVVYPVF